MKTPEICRSHCNLQGAGIAAADVASEAVVAFASGYAKASALALSASQLKRGFSPWGMTSLSQPSRFGDDRVAGRNR